MSFYIFLDITEDDGDVYKRQIEDKSRRAESYLTDDLTYDWTRCEGQRYFMDRAKALGCNNFVLFSNTPPVQYTYNEMCIRDSL